MVTAPSAVSVTVRGSSCSAGNDCAAILSERSSDRVFLRADGAIPYARVVTVMGALNAAGITNIGLVTDMGGPRLDGRGG